MSKADADAIQKLEETISSGKPFSAWLIDEIKAVIAIAKRAIAVDESEFNSLSNCSECGEFRGHGHECKPVEKWPKWYKISGTIFRRHKNGDHYLVNSDGTEVKQNCNGSILDGPEFTLITESEALARITPQKPEKHVEPVESPDDWVTQDRVPDRDYTDEWRWVYKTSVTPWYKTNGPPHKKHGETNNGSRFEVRCRRRDLPKPVPTRCETCDGKGGYSDGVSDEWYTCRDCYEAPVPTVERIPVRLWREHCSGNVLATINQDDEPIDLSDEADEIVSDGNGGWYVEVAK